MSSEFYDNFVSQNEYDAAVISTLQKKNYSYDNQKKIRDNAKVFSSQIVSDYFDALEIESKEISELQIYAIDKLRQLTQFVLNASNKCNEHLLTTFRTAVNCHNNDRKISTDFIRAAYSTVQKIDAEDEKLIVRRNTSSEAKNVQTTSTRQALCMLKVIKETRRDEFELVTDSATTQALLAKLDVSLSQKDA